MNRYYRLLLAPICSLVLAVPAFAGISVTTPYNGQQVSTYFHLIADATSCSGTSVVSMGYSMDSSSNTTIFKSQSIDTHISSSTGWHTLHVKAWGSNGASCVEDKSIDVTSIGTTSYSTSSSSLSVPSSSLSFSSLQVLSNWRHVHDSGTSGSSSGYTDLVTSPSYYGTTRRTVTSFSNNGGERYSVQFSDNSSAENFVYDGWVYLTSSSNDLANLEFDINQTMPNGQTVMTGVQCSRWTGTWEYNANTGSASSPRLKWISSGAGCNPSQWKQYAWHHIQFSLSRDSSGYLTYNSIWLDGKEITLNKKVYGAVSLGWGPALQTQFQVDGYGSSGHVTAYLDDLKISVW